MFSARRCANLLRDRLRSPEIRAIRAAALKERWPPVNLGSDPADSNVCLSSSAASPPPPPPPGGRAQVVGARPFFSDTGASPSEPAGLRLHDAPPGLSGGADARCVGVVASSALPSTAAFRPAKKDAMPSKPDPLRVAQTRVALSRPPYPNARGGRWDEARRRWRAASIRPLSAPMDRDLKEKASVSAFIVPAPTPAAAPWAPSCGWAAARCARGYHASVY